MPRLRLGAVCQGCGADANRRRVQGCPPPGNSAPAGCPPGPLTATPDRHDAADLVLLGEVAGADEHLSFWTGLRQPELLRRLLPPGVLAEVGAALDGYRTAASVGEVEAILDRPETSSLGGQHVNLTHHRVKRRAVHPLIRDILPDAYGRLNLKRLWVGEGDARWTAEARR